MPIPYRRDLGSFLQEFADGHRGVRLGKMFGLPAIYVGRRLCACLMEGGVIVRLPEDVARRELQKDARPYSRRGHAMGTWVMYEPRHAAAARRLTPIIEIAARHVARRVAEDLTGMRIRRK